jgi:hypothetical protein
VDNRLGKDECGPSVIGRPNGKFPKYPERIVAKDAFFRHQNRFCQGDLCVPSSPANGISVCAMVALAKNTAQLFSLFALANLALLRQLLSTQGRSHPEDAQGAGETRKKSVIGAKWRRNAGLSDPWAPGLLRHPGGLQISSCSTRP